MNKAAPVQPEFTQNLDARNRNGTIWHLIFQASTIFGIIALIAMLLNIINGAMGYVAYEGRIDPATLTVDGITIEKQSREQLVSLLQTKLSKGAYNKLDNEKPFAERSRSEIYQLVLERVVRIEVKDNWNLWESLTQANQIKATVAQDYPKAQLKFVSWLNRRSSRLHNGWPMYRRREG